MSMSKLGYTGKGWLRCETTAILEARHPASGIRHPASGIRHPAGSSIDCSVGTSSRLRKFEVIVRVLGDNVGDSRKAVELCDPEQAPNFTMRLFRRTAFTAAARQAIEKAD
ncbi:hypothetical protein ABWJ92_28640 [Streptomyces sp. NPDC000609]|uniref:hypothetical protein n=1 Tax=Streptomyces sp. NPDC000609 TaxID=3160957 RepID=UPI003399E08D